MGERAWPVNRARAAVLADVEITALRVRAAAAEMWGGTMEELSR